MRICIEIYRIIYFVEENENVIEEFMFSFGLFER